MQALANGTPSKIMADEDRPVGRYPYYVLTILTIIYMVNFIDRQIISVLAVDIKRDLGLTDADLGFLYGTAFGVFYAIFGIPMGRLADSWNRVRLTTIGLSIWSAMTAVSGLAGGAAQLTVARFGVGIGEATASPCAYSLLSDYFPRRKRATAIAIYSSGLYLGAGVSLLIGGVIVQGWNTAYPGGGWYGLVGWQVAFFAVGLPGILLAAWMSTVREPMRGQSDGLPMEPSAHPFRGFFEELLIVIPPLTLVGAAKRGTGALVLNFGVAVLIAGAAFAMFRMLGNALQWGALGLGCYAVYSWASALRARDLPTFRLIWGTPAFMLTVVGLGLLSAAAYAVSFWMLPYAETVLGASKATAALIIGGGGAAGGFIGSALGGRFADHLRRTNPSGRFIVVLAAAIIPVPFWIACFWTKDLTLLYALQFPMTLVSSACVGAVGASLQDLVLPRMRGAATATMFLGVTLLGLALGPYFAGRISAATGDLALGVLSVMLAIPVAVVLIIVVYFKYPQAEASQIERARQAGEVI